MRHRDRSLVQALGIAVLATALSAGVVLADTPVDHSGRVGPHYLSDSAEDAGVTCRYVGDGNFRAVVVRPPALFARDRTGSRDEQRVGWRVIVVARHEAPGAPPGWKTWTRGPLLTARAWDDQAAPLRAVRVAVSGEALPEYSFRVKVRMTWYLPATQTTEGSALHRVDWYATNLGGPPIDYCSGFMF